MIYAGEFTSIDGRDFRIEITTQKASGATRQLKLSGSPFVSSVKGDDTNLYTPVRCGGATVGILAEGLIEDFYAGSPKAVAVNLYDITDGRKTVWTGYVAPTCYTQGWDEALEELELDCVDGIAVLKNIKYTAPAREIRTFAEIIARCLTQSGCYRYLYVSDNVQLESPTGTEAVLERFRISEAALFKRKDDVNQPDEDVAWSCHEVLSQICSFLGYTLVADGDSVVMLDYDAIRKGRNSYFRYTIGDGNLTGRTYVSLPFSLNIGEGSYAEGGTSVDMTQVFNKVTVADEFNTFKTEEAPEENITALNDPYFNEAYIEGMNNFNTVDACDTIVETDAMGNNITYQIFVHRMHEERWYYTVVKFFKNPKFTFHRYTKESPYREIARDEDGTGICMATRGGSYHKYCHIELDDNDKAWHASFLYKDRKTLSKYSMEQRRDEWVRLLNSKFASLNFTDCLLFMNGNNGTGGHIGITNWYDTYEFATAGGNTPKAELYTNYPFLEYSDDNPAVFGSRDAYLLIKGNVTTHDQWWNPWPMNNGADNNKLQYKKEHKDAEGMFMWARLQWGNRWWNGEEWQSSECFFRMIWWKGIKESPTTGGMKQKQFLVSQYFDKSIPLVNTDQANYVVGEDAYAIGAPQDGNLSGKIHLTLYCPRDIWDSNHGLCRKYYTSVQCISNFRIEGKINAGGSLGDESALDSDTVYTNLVENGAVEEMEEITFRINTFDNKNSSYSVVDYLDGLGMSHFVDTLFNKALHQEEGSAMRQEEHMVYKLATQCCDPRIVFNCSVKSDRGIPLYGLLSASSWGSRRFVIDSLDCDFRMNKTALRLVEKV